MRLGLDDCIDFSLSMHSFSVRQRAFLGCLFRGIELRNDVQKFLANPPSRMARAADSQEKGLGYRLDYTGKPQSLRGLSVDWQRRTIHFPDGLDDAVRVEAAKFLLPESVPNTGALARYRRRWIGNILDLYKNSPTRLIFLQLPRGPLINPYAVADRAERFVDLAASRPRVTVLPPDTLADLERPELFADGLHLNYLGRPVFSERVAKKTEEVLRGAVH